MPRRIAIASDHAGYDYKTRIAALLSEWGYQVVDFGVDSTESSDYPDYARVAAAAVAEGNAELGILICGSGIGVCMVANKVRGIRAANCLTEEMAQLARDHNDANILTLGERLVDWATVPGIVRTFLTTDASTLEKHRRRVGKIDSLTDC